jgi:hypothetical protein
MAYIKGETREEWEARTAAEEAAAASAPVAVSAPVAASAPGIAASAPPSPFSTTLDKLHEEADKTPDKNIGGQPLPFDSNQATGAAVGAALGAGAVYKDFGKGARNIFAPGENFRNFASRNPAGPTPDMTAMRARLEAIGTPEALAMAERLPKGGPGTEKYAAQFGASPVEAREVASMSAAQQDIPERAGNIQKLVNIGEGSYAPHEGQTMWLQDKDAQALAEDTLKRKNTEVEKLRGGYERLQRSQGRGDMGRAVVRGGAHLGTGALTGAIGGVQAVRGLQDLEAHGAGVENVSDVLGGATAIPFAAAPKVFGPLGAAFQGTSAGANMLKHGVNLRNAAQGLSAVGQAASPWLASAGPLGWGALAATQAPALGLTAYDLAKFAKEQPEAYDKPQRLPTPWGSRAGFRP